MAVPEMIDSRHPLHGRVALLTGVSRRVGIGFATASRLAALGADLFLHSFAPFDAVQPWGADADGIIPLLAELRGCGVRVEHLEADFADPNAPKTVIDEAVRTFGHVDILVANHAYSTSGTLEELNAAQIDAHLQVNVRGSLLLAQAFAAQHDGRPGGRPGATDTGYASAEVYAAVRDAAPQKRWGQPEDAARLIGWLCTDDARWVTGQVINSTGGGL